VRSKLSNCVPFQAGDFGFTVDCVAQCENILTIDLAQIDLAVGLLGVLDDTALQNVIKAIATSPSPTVNHFNVGSSLCKIITGDASSHGSTAHHERILHNRASELSQGRAGSWSGQGRLGGKPSSASQSPS
jgi:hypothetical protein